MIDFFMHIPVPTATHQTKKVCLVGGYPRFYEPKKLKDARELLMANLEKHRPEKPMEGAVKLTTEWVFHRGKSHKKDFWKITRPDTDNLVKLLKDCMTASGFWKDDAQVAWEVTEKFYGETEGILVRVEELK